MRGMFRQLRNAAAAVTLIVGLASPAAASVDSPVASNAYITYNGYDWAWASPIYPSSIDLSYQSQFGWHLPSVEELLLAPLATQFIFAGANVPLNGVDPITGANFQYGDASLNGDAALATPYFNDSYLHGDWCNAPGSNCTGDNAGNFLPWNSPDFISESLVVRVAAGAAPEPGTWAMMLLGFGAVGFAMRRRRSAPRLQIA